MNKTKLFNVRNQARRITGKLKLPVCCMNGDMVLTITGNRSVFVENFRGIQEYTTENLVIKGNRYCVRICGEQIHMDYYTEESVCISGIIRSVNLGCFQTF